MEAQLRPVQLQLRAKESQVLAERQQREQAQSQLSKAAENNRTLARQNTRLLQAVERLKAESEVSQHELLTRTAAFKVFSEECAQRMRQLQHELSASRAKQCSLRTELQGALDTLQQLAGSSKPPHQMQCCAQVPTVASPWAADDMQLPQDSFMVCEDSAASTAQHLDREPVSTTGLHAVPAEQPSPQDSFVVCGDSAASTTEVENCAPASEVNPALEDSADSQATISMLQQTTEDDSFVVCCDQQSSASKESMSTQQEQRAPAQLVRLTKTVQLLANRGTISLPEPAEVPGQQHGELVLQPRIPEGCSNTTVQGGSRSIESQGSNQPDEHAALHTDTSGTPTSRRPAVRAAQQPDSTPTDEACGGWSATEGPREERSYGQHATCDGMSEVEHTAGSGHEQRNSEGRESVAGGTAWAYHMAALLNKPIFLFDDEASWYSEAQHTVVCTAVVVLDGHLRDAAWKASQLWTDEYLIAHAGNAKLEVEERHSEEDGYGKGRKTRMTFGECLRRLAAGDSTLYLTTQQVAIGEDGHPEVYGHPITQLARDLPVRPALLGNLIPQQINIWAGCAPDGSSTGLHHDYHDNLYVLLRGRKQFRLYPPSLADRMYVHGQLQRVHPNGRIVHKSQGDVLADGSDAREVAQWRARRAAEEELREAEEALSRGEKGAEARLAAAEERLDQALEAALDDEGGWGEGFDDFDTLDAGGEEDSDDGEEEAEGDRGASEGSSGGSPAAADTGKAGDPDSFSRVDLSRPAKQLQREFPLFPGKAAAMVCDVSAGQMLFVPAGWFHEVTSFSAPGSTTHLALNYWCHPPDNLDPGPTGFQQPYKSGFWPDVWEGRAHKYAAAAFAVAAAPTPEGAAGLAPVAVEASPRAELVAERAQLAAAEPQEQTEAQNRQQCQLQPEQEKEERVGEPPREVAQSRKRRREERSDLYTPPRGLKARMVHQLAGFFGFGRRQFLHRFITVRLRGDARQG
ncbi:hypothetical protein N2152v2_001807 [Parachlorella kessleri]